MQGGSKKLTTKGIECQSVPNNSCFAVALMILHLYALWATSKAVEKKNGRSRSRRMTDADKKYDKLMKFVEHGAEEPQNTEAVDFLRTFLPNYTIEDKVTLDQARQVFAEYHSRENNRIYMFDEGLVLIVFF